MNVSVTRLRDLRTRSSDAGFDAWLFNCLLDNNLLHSMNPQITASREQLRFMVHLEHDQPFLPCRDTTFFDLCQDTLSDNLKHQYERAWRMVMSILDTMPYPESERERIRGFCRYRFDRYVSSHNVIPSRVVKRLVAYVTALNGPFDPWVERRAEAIARHKRTLSSDTVTREFQYLPAECFPGMKTIRDMNRHLHLLVLARYASLMANVRAWSENFPSGEELRRHFAEAENKMEALGSALDVLGRPGSTILLLSDADGGTLYDLSLAHFFTAHGLKVIYAVKEGFYFHSPTMQDVQENDDLREALRGAHVITNPSISKNDLLKALREWRLVVISDGTRERLNLARVSVTFSRAWKESDLVIAHGWRKRFRLIDTSVSFTRDILCFWEDRDGFDVRFRPHDPAERKFSEAEINALSDAIIEEMREARAKNRPVVFYSCVIGSIPGETKTATSLVNAFVGDLRKRMPEAYIINPAEHFVEGMDGDDLMFMWERVQRSGYITVWRFQTAEDIEKGFALLGRDVPQKWIGKDSTFSTGCTQEMHIAQDVLRKNPEMQIVGPAPERFFRRRSYGVGKYFDAQLASR